MAITTSHGKFNAHLKKMNLVKEIESKYCDDEETV